MKLGGIHNFSTVPVKTCASGVPCAEHCYAMKAWRCYPSVRAAWGENTRLLQEEHKYTEFTKDLVDHILKHDLEYFRFSVAGDIFCNEYLDAIVKIAEECPTTYFWLYTKQYEVLARHIKARKTLPDNLSIIVSEWNDYKPSEELSAIFGRALYNDGSKEMPEKGFECPSDCRECKYCATMNSGDIVIFNKH